jgi:hypothetical protein
MLRLEEPDDLIAAGDEWLQRFAGHPRTDVARPDLVD